MWGRRGPRAAKKPGRAYKGSIRPLSGPAAGEIVKRRCMPATLPARRPDAERISHDETSEPPEAGHREVRHVTRTSHSHWGATDEGALFTTAPARNPGTTSRIPR